MQTDDFEESHLYFLIVDVGREAEGDFRVVRVVFAVSDVDVHFNLVFLCFDQHPGGGNENPSGHVAVMHKSPHTGAVTHQRDLPPTRSSYCAAGDFIYLTLLYNKACLK